MENESLRALLFLAFGMGMVHAVDADHVMAVTTLASRRPSFLTSLGYALRWAAGHATSLFAIALLWLAFGLHMPAWVGRLAEWSVAALLIGMGAALLSTLRRRRLRLAFHTHTGLSAHAHWHSDTSEDVEGAKDGHRHSAVLIGVLHGVAGSAPLLALIPAVAQGEPRWAVVHLTVFSIGMLLAMLACGGLFGAVTRRLAAPRFGRGLLAVRGLVGVCAIGAGANLAVGLWLAG